MKQFDPVQAWLDNVAYSHSKSENTEKMYRISLRDFCEFIGCTPQQILKQFERMTDRQFRRTHAQNLRDFISELTNNGCAPNTVSCKIATVKSFFKYNDLPLGYVPTGRNKIVFHNRDVTKQEIVEILKTSRPRDRAFFCMMAQSGLRPDTLCNLRLKHIEPDFTNGTVPCKIEVPEELAKGEFGAYFTFMGEESMEQLKAYLDKRPSTGPEDYLFTSHGTDKQFSKKSISSIFKRTIEALKQKGMMDFEQKQHGKPRSVRLYNLRKFFRNHAGQAGIEYVNYWMGHKTNYKAPHIPASDMAYFPKEDVEFQRQLYKEKAMPHLRLETATPTEMEQTVKELREKLEARDKELETLKRDLQSEIERLVKINIEKFFDEQVADFRERVRKSQKNPH